jgi:hypothetical protein
MTKRGAKTTKIGQRAAELLAVAKNYGPCKIGRSAHRALIEEMARQGGNASLICRVSRSDLGYDVGRSCVDRHLKHECRCYQPDRRPGGGGPR